MHRFDHITCARYCTDYPQHRYTTFGTGATFGTGVTLNRGAAVAAAVIVTGIIALVIGVLTVILFYCIFNHRSQSCKPKSSFHQWQQAVPSFNTLQPTESMYEEVTELRLNKTYGPIQTGIKMRANETYGPMELPSCQEQQTGTEYEEVQVPATSGKHNIELRENEAYRPMQEIKLRENEAYGPVQEIKLRENEAYGPVQGIEPRKNT